MDEFTSDISTGSFHITEAVSKSKIDHDIFSGQPYLFTIVLSDRLGQYTVSEFFRGFLENLLALPATAPPVQSIE